MKEITQRSRAPFPVCPNDNIMLNNSIISQPEDFPGDAVVKHPSANAGDTGDLGLVSGLGLSPDVGNGNRLQYSCLENSKDRGAWWTIVQEVAKNRTWLSTHNQNSDSNKFNSPIKKSKLLSSDVLRNDLSGDKNLNPMLFFYKKFSLIVSLGNQTETYVNHLLIKQTQRKELLSV